MGSHGNRQPRLASYRQKRDASRTPEPFGGADAQRPGLFVVQKHAARRMHYDFRLAWRGTLLSWAIPRGPSLDPADKRLAIRVEDHPLEYADFEGVIPPGNYGAGAVIVWDRGRWTPLEDPDAGLERGKLLFELHGYKLRGRFTLVRTRGTSGRDGKEQWLWIAKHRGRAAPGEPGEESVLSGLRVEERQDAAARAQPLRAALESMGAPRGRVAVAKLRPMLAEARARPFSRPGWLFEVKYDGYRVLAGREGGEPFLRSRNGRDLSPAFPELVSALAALPYDPIVLDGELVVADAEGRPRFALLQQRARLSRQLDVQRAAVERPATLYAFDLLVFEDRDLRPLPLRERKALLEPLLPPRGPLRYAPHYEERGEQVFAEVEKHGFEGVIAKRADSAYRTGRSPLWLKIRTQAADDFVIVGFTAPRSGRTGFGALHLAGFDAGRLRYAGRVGSGFDEAGLRALRERLETLGREQPACTQAPPGKGTRWVEPELVCEVRYREVTRHGQLRQPVFVRLREDKPPGECLHPAARTSDGAADEGGEASPARAENASRELVLSNLDKVFWPEARITKGELIAYHRAIAPWLLPYLRDRPLVLTRYPDGITGKFFFQKHAPEWTPDWLRTETVYSEHGEREVRYFVAGDLESLLFLVNLGTIPLHVWGSRVATLQRPDWCILDLDPKGAPFAHVARVARSIRRLCQAAEIPSFVKTSGSEGLHVMLPLGARLSFEQTRTLAELLARLVVTELPEIATVARRPKDREGRVYVDYLQNGHGQLLVAPFSVRSLPGAPVSMPLRWGEVRPGLDVRRFHLRNAATRMRRLGEDPLRPVLDQALDLPRALARLAALRGAPTRR